MRHHRLQQLAAAGRSVLSSRWAWAAAAFTGVAVIAAGCLLLAYAEHIPDPDWLRTEILNLLGRIPPLLYFIAFATLPAFGAPLTLFYLTALPVMGSQNVYLGVACAWLALLSNMSLAKLLVSSCLRPLLQSVLSRQQRQIPQWKRSSEWQVVLAVRLSPLPFPIQNWVLAMGNARWRTYLWLSWPIQCAIGLGMMLVGNSLLAGGLGYVFFAVIVFICIHLLISRLRKKIPPADAASNP